MQDAGQPPLAAATTATISSPVAEERILFAINPLEIKTFFPEGIPEFGSKECIQWEVHDTRFISGEEWESLLQDFSPTVIVSAWTTPRITENILNSSWFSVKYICHLPGSVKKLLPPLAFEKDLLISNWGSLASDAVAEHALLLVMACLRRLPQWNPVMRLEGSDYQEQRVEMQTRTLYGKRVGLHGFGKVARELVNLLKPFKVKLSAYSEGVPHAFMREHGVKPCDSLATLFAENQVLIECEALTQENQGSVDAHVLEQLDTGDVLVNVGRGAIIDEDALLRRIQAGGIRVGLDVFSSEPIGADSPFWQVPDVLYSPHIAGPAQDGFGLCSELARANIDRYLKGLPVEAQVTLEEYQRST
ncbi:hydroxyacid dehydrogenase [Ruficoccus sp. ZRK36]|uniref:hydroxyacid dehydrogenase n=1 Tax=Ruficoccus sp. ZRK36 TaxID=2866311 RepID=UPI001C7362F8|nr:hydroxyacid dehydrogenase [Ruficoccus sp. ZRK36]QYY35107.1 hydroxyacid dehydrogenase [Ruficoccus sp. ZRK36]